MDDYNKLNEKYVESETKVATINGLLMVQAMCSRKLMDKHSRDILELMEDITKAIDALRNSD